MLCVAVALGNIASNGLFTLLVITLINVSVAISRVFTNTPTNRTRDLEREIRIHYRKTNKWFETRIIASALIRNTNKNHQITKKLNLLELVLPVNSPKPVIYKPFMLAAALSIFMVYMVFFFGNNLVLALALDIMFLAAFFTWIFMRYTGRLTMQVSSM
jgi:hypothetical protein